MTGKKSNLGLVRAASGLLVLVCGLTNAASFADFKERLSRSSATAKDVSAGEVGTITCGDTVTGMLNLLSDNLFNDGTAFDQYSFDATLGMEITLDLTSPDFDSFLILQAPSGVQVVDDNSGSGNNSRIASFVIDEEGSWQIGVNTVTPQNGTYAMTLNCNGADFQAVDGNTSGSWNDASHNGEGWKIEILADGRALIYWFTYPPEGGQGIQSWIIGIGQVVGNKIIVDESLTSAGSAFGAMFDPDMVVNTEWGTFTFEFSGPNAGMMTYEGPSDWGSGALELQRITAIPQQKKINKASHPDNLGPGISGSYFDPSRSGQGWAIEVINETEALIYWFTFDENGDAAWNISIGTIKGNLIVVQDALETSGTNFGNIFDPDAVALKSWGNYTIAFTDCNNAVISFGSKNGLGFGTYQISRFTTITGLACVPLDADAAPDNTVAINPGDSLAISAMRPDGYDSEVFVQKSTSGTTERVSQVMLRDPDGKEAIMTTDDEGRPMELVEEESGDSVGFGYTDDPDRVVLTGTADGGSIQVNFGIDISPINKRGTIFYPFPEKNEPRKGMVKAYDGVLNPPALAQKSHGTSRITVEQCGARTDLALVELKVTVGDEVLNFPAIAQGNGVYDVVLPTQAANSGAVSADEACTSFVESMDDTCAFINRLENQDLLQSCELLAGAMVNPDDLQSSVTASDFLYNCVTALYLQKRSCEATGGSGAAVGQSSADFACGNVVDNVDRSLDALSGTAIFLPTVRFPGRGVAESGSGESSSVFGPYPDFSFSDDTEVAITQFSTSPVAPVAGQNYLAIFSVACASPETSVTLGVVGGDGFNGSGSCTVSGAATCAFTIPGREGGVVDVITVAVDGGPTRVISVSTDFGEADLPGGTGDVQISLQWNATVDLDLHVIDPCGTEINFGSRTAVCEGNTGTLDTDNQSGGTGSVENVFWPTAGAPSGGYEYWVECFFGCSNQNASFTLIQLVDGIRTTRTGTLVTDKEESIHYTFSR